MLNTEDVVDPGPLVGVLKFELISELFKDRVDIWPSELVVVVMLSSAVRDDETLDL